METQDTSLDDRLEKLRRLKELKASLEPEYSAQVEHPGITMAKDTGRSMAKGALDMAGGIGSLLQNNPYTMSNPIAAITSYAMGKMKTPESFAAAGKAVGPDEASMTDAQKLWGKTSEGAGAGLAFGGPQNKIVNTLSGAGGGAGGELGLRAGEATKIPYLDKIMQFVGTLIGGGVPAMALGGPRPGTVAVRDAVKGTPKADWDMAAENARLFNSAGARTATVAETFPGNSRAVALAEKARSGPGGEKLAERVKDRAGDLQKLGDEFLNRIAPENSGNVVANEVSSAAEKVLANLRNAKNQQFGATIGQHQIRPDLVVELEQALLKAAQAEQRGGPKLAYREIASKLRNPDTGEIINSSSELSKVMFGLGQAAKNPAGMNAGGSVINANDMSIPLSNAKAGLREISPPFAQATDQATAFNQQVRVPVANSPIGALADRTPSNEFPTPISRLNKVMSGTSPDEAGNILGSLFRAPGQAEPEQVIRAMMQEKLAAGSTNPGATVRGAEGSLQDRRLAAMLAQTERDPQKVMEPLRAADRLQGMGAPQQTHGIEAPPGDAAVTSPTWFLRTLAKMKAEHGKNEAIADLLGGPPTMENLARLQKLAQTDPSIRAYLV